MGLLYLRKSIGSGQLAQSAQTGLGRKFSLFTNFLYFQGLFYPLITCYKNVSIIDLELSDGLLGTMYHGRCINPLPDDEILDCSKLKQVADDILKCIENEK